MDKAEMSQTIYLGVKDGVDGVLQKNKELEAEVNRLIKLDIQRCREFEAEIQELKKSLELSDMVVKKYNAPDLKLKNDQLIKILENVAQSDGVDFMVRLGILKELDKLR